MSSSRQQMAHVILVIGLIALAAVNHVSMTRAQTQEQWKPVGKTLFDYISEGFVIETILLDRITPVSVQATLYFLRKDNLLVRCTETVTRRGGMVTNLSVGCAELTQPAV
jgi:hypothetical protein